MKIFSNPGDCILYIGNCELATDEGTSEVMNYFMSLYSWYTVKKVCDYFGSGLMHYLLEENGAYIPCGCFSIDKKRVIKNRYNLK